jgi:CheY-like chemotaxis protein
VAKPKAAILCIDDDGLELEARKALLENSGYDVLTAQSAREGLGLFVSHLVDAVIVDYRMPKLNGDRVAGQLKRIKPNIPILMLSAHTELGQDKLSHVDGFLCKAESWPTILSALEKLLQTRLASFDRWWENWQHQASSSPDRS